MLSEDSSAYLSILSASVFDAVMAAALVMHLLYFATRGAVRLPKTIIRGWLTGYGAVAALVGAYVASVYAYAGVSPEKLLLLAAGYLLLNYWFAPKATYSSSLLPIYAIVTIPFLGVARLLIAAQIVCVIVSLGRVGCEAAGCCGAGHRRDGKRSLLPLEGVAAYAVWLLCRSYPEQTFLWFGVGGSLIWCVSSYTRRRPFAKTTCLLLLACAGLHAGPVVYVANTSDQLPWELLRGLAYSALLAIAFSRDLFRRKASLATPQSDVALRSGV